MLSKDNSIKKDNVSNIRFDDEDLKIVIGKWLEILDQIKNFNVFKELKGRIRVSKSNSKEIDETFRKLLTIAGIDQNEKCILNNFDKRKLTFNCHLENSDEDAKISLKWGSFVDFSPEFNIKYKNKQKIFEYSRLHKVNSFNFKLMSEEETKNNNTYTRYYSPYFVTISLENEKYELELRVSNVENLDISKIKNYTFELINEPELKEYLLNLEFPIKINELYKKIDDILLYSISKYPNFSLTVCQKMNNNKYRVTDKVVLNHGKLKEFTMTKDEKVSDTYKIYSKDYIGKYRIKYDGKTISISDNNSWKYDSDKISAYKNPDGKMGFSVKEMTKESMENLKTILEEMDSINNEVEKVKKISKTL